LLNCKGKDDDDDDDDDDGAILFNEFICGHLITVLIKSEA